MTQIHATSEVSSIFEKLPQRLRENLFSQGIEKPTAVQQAAYEPVLSGQDMIAQSRTGSGKTLAFGLPAFARLGKPQASFPRLLVLTPTRELAQQVADVFEVNFKPDGFRTLAITGGKSYRVQTSSLKRGLDAIVATPGRLNDLLDQKYVDLTHLEILVLDEMDEMLDFGFAEDILRIKTAIGKKVQTLLFSATFPPKVTTMARQMVTNPHEVKVANTDASASQIEHGFIEVKSGRNLDALLGLLLYHTPDHALIFCKTREETRLIHHALIERGFAAGVLNGEMTQNDRTQTLERFRNKSLRLLVATDVAARGIDVTGLSHVINFTVPTNLETYTHRVGRTGRAGAKGKAWTIIAYTERREFQFICSKAKLNPLRVDLPNGKKVTTQLLQNMIFNMSENAGLVQENISHSVESVLSELQPDNIRTILSQVLKYEASRCLGKNLQIEDIIPTTKTEFGAHIPTKPQFSTPSRGGPRGSYNRGGTGGSSYGKDWYGGGDRGGARNSAGGSYKRTESAAPKKGSEKGPYRPKASGGRGF